MPVSHSVKCFPKKNLSMPADPGHLCQCGPAASVESAGSRASAWSNLNLNPASGNLNAAGERRRPVRESGLNSTGKLKPSAPSHKSKEPGPRRLDTDVSLGPPSSVSGDMMGRRDRRIWNKERTASPRRTCQCGTIFEGTRGRPWRSSAARNVAT